MSDSTPLISLVIAMALSVVAIPIVWRFADRLGMIDEPNHRKVHVHAVPRVGGLGIIFGAMLTMFSMLDFTPINVAFFFGVGTIFLFGFWDDARQVGPYTKFIGQIIAVTLIVFYGDLWIHRLPLTGMDELSPWVGIPFTYFAIIGMTNAMNTSDGLDGLAGGESLLSLIVICFLAFIAEGIEASIIAASCIGGIIGFLRYNTHPAEIFMGDTGSQFLGFSLGFLAVLVTQEVHPALSPALTLLFLGLPVIDLLAVMTMRVVRGGSPFKADRTHIHHRILDLGFDHYETVIIIYSIQSLLVISAIFLRYQSDELIILLYTSIAAIIFGSLYLAERSGWSAQREPVKPLSLTVRYFRSHQIDFIQLAVSVAKCLIPLYILATCLFVEQVPRDFSLLAAVFMLVMLVELISSKQVIGGAARAGIYIIAIFAVYLSVHSVRLSSMPIIDLALFTLLAIAIGIVVRYAIDKKFQTSPMDYLIVFGVLAAAAFAGRYLEVKDVGILIVKSMILLYGCELLYTRQTRRFNSLTLTAIASMGILAYRGLV